MEPAGTLARFGQDAQKTVRCREEGEGGGEEQEMREGGACWTNGRERRGRCQMQRARKQEKNTVIKYPVGRSNAHRAREIAAGSFAFFGPLDCAPLVTFLL